MERKSECPCCGAILNINGDVIWNQSGWIVQTPLGTAKIKGRRQAQLFDLLWCKRGASGLTCQRIIDILFMDALDGGPSPHSITMAMNRLRATVASVGLEIKQGATGGNGYSIQYRPIHIAAQAA